jgi:hypothetical protein
MTMSAALSNEEVQAAWVNLTEEVRTGVLWTFRNGRPFGSHVPYVFGEHWTHAYIHVSNVWRCTPNICCATLAQGCLSRSRTDRRRTPWPCDG